MNSARLRRTRRLALASLISVGLDQSESVLPLFAFICMYICILCICSTCRGSEFAHEVIGVIGEHGCFGNIVAERTVQSWRSNACHAGCSRNLAFQRSKSIAERRDSELAVNQVSMSKRKWMKWMKMTECTVEPLYIPSQSPSRAQYNAVEVPVDCSKGWTIGEADWTWLN